MVTHDEQVASRFARRIRIRDGVASGPGIEAAP